MGGMVLPKVQTGLGAARKLRNAPDAPKAEPCPLLSPRRSQGGTLTLLREAPDAPKAEPCPLLRVKLGHRFI
jgi:hypothetical protein